MTLSINPPEGFEIDKEKSYPNSNEIVYKPIENRLPEKWDDFYNLKGYYLDTWCNIYKYEKGRARETNKNVWPTKELAEASLALCQLVRFRDAWNEGWQPDWTDNEHKYNLRVFCNEIEIEFSCFTRYVLSFKTEEIRDKFAKTFKELIKTAKPLL